MSTMMASASTDSQHEPERLSTSRFEYRVAVALNNMAVSMLERDCYRQGFETLKDAVSAMRMTSTASTTAPQQECRRERLVRMLKVANQRCSRPDMSTGVSVPIRVIPHEPRPSVIPDTTTGDCSQEPSRSDAMTIVRIETESDLLEEDDSNLSATIMLYNLSVAYLCRAQAEIEEESLSAKLHKAGVKLLKLCRKLLASQSGACDNPFLLAQVMYVSIVLVETLFKILLAGGKTEEAKSCASTLVSLRRAVSSVQERFDFVDMSTAAAPAA